MANSQQTTGMRGVYLVAAELAREGYIVSPTSRSAMGADLLVTDQLCRKAWSVQVKTNGVKRNYWLLNARAKKMIARDHVYVLVNILKGDLRPEFFIVPSSAVARGMKMIRRKTGSTWRWVHRDRLMKYKDQWSIFGKP